MNQPENAVVLAIGPEGVDAALGFALAAAQRSHRPLHLVHVLQLPPGEAYAGVYGGALEAAKGVLETASARARQLADGDVPVTSELVDHGVVVDTLVSCSRTASLVVLQHRDLNKLLRLFTGSVSNGVAARAHSPVVSVPEGWEPTSGREPVVTAAVQDADGAAVELRTAFEEARIHAARLVVLHAWWLASGYDVVVVDQAMRDEWEARTRKDLDSVLAPLRERYPEVEVSVSVRHAPPAEAILDAAAASEVLVIARRHHLLPLGTHLGPIARAVLHGSTCPVLVTPESAARVAMSDVGRGMASAGM